MPPQLQGATAGAAPTLDPHAEMRGRLLEIAAALSAIGGLSEPSIVAAKASLAAEKESIEGLLRASKPPKVQLRTALTRLQKNLTAMQSLHDEVVQLEVVLCNRRQALDKVRAEALQSQAEVAAWTQQVRSEELATVAALAPPGGGQLAARPATLLHWAAGFAANAPPGVAVNFQAFLAAQDALNPIRLPEVFSVGDGDDDDMTRDSEEAEYDPYLTSLFGDAELALAVPAATAATTTRLGDHLGASAPGAALLGFGKVKSHRARDSPYDGAAAGDIAAAAGTAALAAEALASAGDGLLEAKTEEL